MRMDVWLQIKVRVCGLELPPRPYAVFVCVAQRRCSSWMRLVALHMCYAFAFYANKIRDWSENKTVLPFGHELRFWQIWSETRPTIRHVMVVH